MSTLSEFTNRIRDIGGKRTLDRLSENDTAGWTFAYDQSDLYESQPVVIKFSFRGNEVANYHFSDDGDTTSSRIETVSTDPMITKRIIKFMERSLEKAIDLHEEVKEKHKIAKAHVAARLPQHRKISEIGIQNDIQDVLTNIDKNFSQLKNPKPFSEIIDGVLVELKPSTWDNGNYVKMSFYAPVSGVTDADAKADMGMIAHYFEDDDWLFFSETLDPSQMISLTKKASVLVYQKLARQDASFGEDRAAIADMEFERAKKLSAEVSQNLAESFGI